MQPCPEEPQPFRLHLRSHREHFQLFAVDPLNYNVRVRIDVRQLAPNEVVEVNGAAVPVEFVRNNRAKRYLLRLTRTRTARVTVPWAGSIAEARAFVWKNRPWLERQLKERAQREPNPLTDGTLIYYKGELQPLQVKQVLDGLELQLGQSRWRAKPGEGIKQSLERRLQRQAQFELPIRVSQLATAHGIRFDRVSIRNQRSRWGSCSSRGTISLNWRLIQVPPAVLDYLVLHELAHLKHMNHSERFWAYVESLCPDYAAAERWLKLEGHKLR
jgi:predicted metal-dependent hydrolase